MDDFVVRTTSCGRESVRGERDAIRAKGGLGAQESRSRAIPGPGRDHLRLRLGGPAAVLPRELLRGRSRKSPHLHPPPPPRPLLTSRFPANVELLQTCSHSYHLAKLSLAYSSSRPDGHGRVRARLDRHGHLCPSGSPWPSGPVWIAMAIWAVRPLAKEMEKLEVEVAGVSIVENKKEIVSV